MKSQLRITKTLVWVSEQVPAIETSNPSHKSILVWADANPVAYTLVMGTKSVRYCRQGTQPICAARGSNDAAAVLDRLACLYAEATSPHPSTRDAALFALAHGGDPKLRGGYFDQLARWTDGKLYSRSCKYLEYTPAMLEAVIDRFARDMDAPKDVGPTVCIALDGRIVRSFAPVYTEDFKDPARVPKGVLAGPRPSEHGASKAKCKKR